MKLKSVGCLQISCLFKLINWNASKCKTNLYLTYNYYLNIKFFIFVSLINLVCFKLLAPHRFHILRLFIFFLLQPDRRDIKTSQVLHLANCSMYWTRFLLLADFNRIFFHIWLVLIIFSSVTVQDNSKSNMLLCYLFLRKFCLLQVFFSR